MANPPLDWGHPQTLSAWRDYLLAKQYQGFMFKLPLKSVLANLLTFLRDVPQEFWWLGLALVLLGGVLLFLRDRRFFAATAVTFVIAVIWLSNYNIPWEIDVYYLPALFVLAIWLGLCPELAARARSGACPSGDRPGAVRGSGLHAGPALPKQRPLAAGLHAGPWAGCAGPASAGRNDPASFDQPDVRAALPDPVRAPAAGCATLLARLDKGVAPVKEAVYPADEVKITPEARFVAERLAQGGAVFARRAASAERTNRVRADTLGVSVSARAASRASEMAVPGARSAGREAALRSGAAGVPFRRRASPDCESL